MLYLYFLAIAGWLYFLAPQSPVFAFVYGGVMVFLAVMNALALCIAMSEGIPEEIMRRGISIQEIILTTAIFIPAAVATGGMKVLGLVCFAVWFAVSFVIEDKAHSLR